MKIVKPSHRILNKISEGGIDELKLIEECARTSYRSEDRITEDGESAKIMVEKLIKNGHESCLEHSSMSVIFVCDRAIANELERHRLASFTQESTRYVNVKAEKLGADGEMQVILPRELQKGYELYTKLNSDSGEQFDVESDVYEYYQYLDFKDSVEYAEAQYNSLILRKVLPEIARSVLPLSLATKVAMTANYREWRHIFKLRCEEHAHPDMRDLMIPLLHEAKQRIPVVFDDIPY